MNWSWGRGVCNVPRYFCVWRDLGADQRTHLSLLVLLFVLSLKWRIQAGWCRPSGLDKIVPLLPSLPPSRVKPRPGGCPCPRATPHSFHRPPSCPRARLCGRRDSPTLPTPRSQERGAEIFPTTGESSWPFHLTDRLLRQFSLFITAEKMILSPASLNYFWSICTSTFCPFQGNLAPTGRSVATPDVPNKEERQKKCSDSPWITALLKKPQNPPLFPDSTNLLGTIGQKYRAV